MRKLTEKEKSLLLEAVRLKMHREAEIALDLGVKPYGTVQPYRTLESMLRVAQLFVDWPQAPEPEAERFLETRLPSGEKKMIPEKEHLFYVPPEPKPAPEPKRLPFTVIVPAALPCQKEKKHDLMVEVKTDEGVDILTPEAHEIIETVKMQSSISMLYDAVKILHETINRRD